jgi:hypothetical protein
MIFLSLSLFACFSLHQFLRHVSYLLGEGFWISSLNGLFLVFQYLQMKWPLLDVQAGSLQSRQALKDARSPSPAHIVVSKPPKDSWSCALLMITGLACQFFFLGIFLDMVYVYKLFIFCDWTLVIGNFLSLPSTFFSVLGTESNLVDTTLIGHNLHGLGETRNAIKAT